MCSDFLGRYGSTLPTADTARDNPANTGLSVMAVNVPGGAIGKFDGWVLKKSVCLLVAHAASKSPIGISVSVACPNRLTNIFALRP